MESLTKTTAALPAKVKELGLKTVSISFRRMVILALAVERMISDFLLLIMLRAMVGMIGKPSNVIKYTLSLEEKDTQIATRFYVSTVILGDQRMVEFVHTKMLYLKTKQKSVCGNMLHLLVAAMWKAITLEDFQKDLMLAAIP